MLLKFGYYTFEIIKVENLNQLNIHWISKWVICDISLRNIINFNAHHHQNWIPVPVALSFPQNLIESKGKLKCPHKQTSTQPHTNTPLTPSLSFRCWWWYLHQYLSQMSRCRPHSTRNNCSIKCIFSCRVLVLHRRRLRLYPWLICFLVNKILPSTLFFHPTFPGMF